MLILKILENDLHRSKRGVDAVPLIVYIPARLSFLPALVSNSVGKFLVVRKMSKDDRIGVGVFQHDSDKMDEKIPDMIQAAFDLSKAEKWENVFSGSKALSDGFDHIAKESNMPVQPHVCLVPNSWTIATMREKFRTKIDPNIPKYRRFCRIVNADVPVVTFLSRPDMVGMYTHFLGGPASILLHNVKRGMAFCEA